MPFRPRALFVGLFSAVLLSCSQATDDTLVEPLWPHDESDIAPDPDVLFGQLDNGMRYAILANQTPKRTASIRMSIDYGSLNENEDERGLFHFLEHMAFNGSTNVPEGEMIKILERLGLAFGPDTNASTSFDEVQYQLDLPDVTDELLDTGLFLMRETASELTLAPSAIDRERGVILSEKRARNSIGLRQYEAFSSFLMPNARVTQRLPIGLEEVIKSASAETFEDIYKTYYRPEDTTMVIVGDVDVADIEGRIKSVFSDWSAASSEPEKVTAGDFDFDRPTSVGTFIDPDVQPTALLIYPFPYVETSDTAADRIERLERSIAFSIINRRFARKARSADAPYLSAGISQSSTEELFDYISIGANALPGKWPEALAEIEQEFRRAREYGFTEAEVQEQLANIEAGQVANAERSKTRQTSSLAGQLIGSLQSDRVFNTPESSLARFLASKDEITPDSVKASLDVFNKTSPPQIFLTLPAEYADLETVALETLTASVSVAVTDETTADAGTFAYTDFGRPGPIVEDSTLETYDIRTIRFANNVRLNLKKTDFQDKAILISLRVGGGRLEFPLSPDGLPVFASASFNSGGLVAHSTDELRSLLAGKLVNSSLNIGTTALTGRTSTQADDVLTQFQLWAARLTAPGYREEGERLWRRQVETIYEQLDATPGAILSNEVSRFLRSGHTHFGLSSKEDLLALDYKTLKPYLRRMLEEGAVEIGVVGEFNPDDIIAAVAQTFGALPLREEAPLPFERARASVAFTEERGVKVFKHAGLAENALIQFVWQLPDGSNDRLESEIDLLMEVFNLKLTDTLREALGATYSPSTNFSMSDVYKGFGLASATAEISPDDMETVADAIQRVAEDMANGGISADDLERARKPVVERFDETLESNRFWLSFVDQAQTKPEDLNWIEDRKSFYGDVTPDELIAHAQTYLAGQEPLIIQIISDKLD